MPNVSKIILNGTILMDATSATATANEIIAPYTAMTADGEMTVGTGSGGDWLFYSGASSTLDGSR